MKAKILPLLLHGRWLSCYLSPPALALAAQHPIANDLTSTIPHFRFNTIHSFTPVLVNKQHVPIIVVDVANRPPFSFSTVPEKQLAACSPTALII
jgi:hypothetical protein